MFQRIALHIAFWLAYWLIYAYTYSRYDGDLMKYLITEGLQMPARMLATYAAFWCFERYGSRGAHWKAFGGAALASIAGGFINRALKFWYLVPVYFPSSTIQFLDFRFVYDLFDVVLACSTALSARMFFRQQELQQRETVLRAEKLNAELLALKSQIHPHFLFNTINNLYVLARMKSDKTPQVALKLAHLLRYVLYESAKTEVPLSQELQLLKDYVALEQLRFDEERLNVQWTESIDDRHQNLTPLLLLPLVENAFKHGVSEKREDAWVRISIGLQQKILTLEVGNSLSADTPETLPGIGLKNLQRQLELLYPGHFELSAGSGGDHYLARLTLNLCEY